MNKVLALLFGCLLQINAQITNITLSSQGAGRIELQYNGLWGTICDDHFDMDDAQVVCRQIYGSKSDIAVPTGEGVFGPGAGKIHFDELACVGTETSVELCGSSSFKDCFHSEDAGVICDSSKVNLRLVNGSDNFSGRLEVNINGVWGTVCDDEFNSDAAKLVCKALGLPSTYAYVGHFGFGTGQIWMDDVSCTGSEHSFLMCNQSALGDNDCDHTEDVGVYCTDKEPNVQVRLVGGSAANEGRVEINFNGVWGTVCDDEWDDDDARVVCSMLNMYNGTARAVGQAFFGFGTGTIQMDDVECSGTEANVALCNFGGFGNHDCDHSEDAGVICHAEGGSGGIDKIRLVGGANEYEGRVEVLHNGRWGTVCDDQFDDREAKVVCGMLGYPNLTSIGVSESRFGDGTGPIFMDELACSGAEKSLGDCRFDGYGNHDCDHTEDAGVICNATKTELQVRLVDGKSTNEGRLEVFYQNSWGTVCDDNFNADEAKVVCKMLGYGTQNAEGIHNAFFGSGTGPIWLDNVNCRGTEGSIGSCRHNPFSVNNCDHDEDVGVRCGDRTESPIRLAGGAGPFEGRVEVFHEGKWGTVCDDQFSMTDAKVICNLVGYPTDNPVIRLGSNQTFGQSTGPIWLDDVVCTGTEPSIDQCVHNRWGNNNCDHSEDVAVVCRDHGIKCYHCDGLQDPRTCGETIQCAAGEACEEAAYIINGETRFSLTCQSQLVCDALSSGGPIGKRESTMRRQTGGQTTRLRCCTTALCNRDLLDVGQGGHSTGTGTCQDKPGTDCNALQNINICASANSAKLLCPKTCGLCP